MAIIFGAILLIAALILLSLNAPKYKTEQSKSRLEDYKIQHLAKMIFIHDRTDDISAINEVNKILNEYLPKATPEDKHKIDVLLSEFRRAGHINSEGKSFSLSDGKLIIIKATS